MCGGGGTIEDGIKKLYQEIKLFYNRTKCQHKLASKPTQDRLQTSAGYPKLKAKAAQTRA